MLEEVLTFTRAEFWGTLVDSLRAGWVLNTRGSHHISDASEQFKGHIFEIVTQIVCAVFEKVKLRGGG